MWPSIQQVAEKSDREARWRLRTQGASREGGLRPPGPGLGRPLLAQPPPPAPRPAPPTPCLCRPAACRSRRSGAGPCVGFGPSGVGGGSRGVPHVPPAGLGASPGAADFLPPSLPPWRSLVPPPEPQTSPRECTRQTHIRQRPPTPHANSHTSSPGRAPTSPDAASACPEPAPQMLCVPSLKVARVPQV